MYDWFVLERLEREIEDLEIPVDERVLLELYALRDRLDARIATAAGEVDAAELWRGDGSVRSRSSRRT